MTYFKTKLIKLNNKTKFQMIKLNNSSNQFKTKLKKIEIISFKRFNFQ